MDDLTESRRRSHLMSMLKYMDMSIEGKISGFLIFAILFN